MKYKSNLRKKIVAGLVGFALFIILCTSVFVTVYYYRSRMREYTEAAFADTRAAAKYIEGDRIRGYIEPVGTDENGKPVYQTDEYYDDIQEYLTVTQSEYALMMYYYVCIPGEDDIFYIWYTDTTEGEVPLGYIEPYTAGEKEAMLRAVHPGAEEKLTFFNDQRYGRFASAYSPIYDSQGEVAAIAGVDYSIEGIERVLLHFVLRIIISVFLVTAATVVNVYIQIRKRLLDPIEQLNSATKNLVDDLDTNHMEKLNIKTGDELEELAGSFGKMNADLHDYIDRLTTVTAEKEKIGAELNVAAKIQSEMLPGVFPPFPDRHEFELYAVMDPAKEVGGDFYDFFFIDKDHLCLVIADVSGKGVPAALFMVISKVLIKTRAREGIGPAEILHEVNEQLCQGNESEMFVTVWIAILDVSTGKGMAANAGHEHPILRRAGKDFELVEYRHSFVLGTMEGIPFSEHEFELHPGDCLFVYTDGLPESTNEKGELFGTDRTLQELNRDPELPLDELLKNVHQAADAFSGTAPQFDDLTMLGFRYFGKQ